VPEFGSAAYPAPVVDERSAVAAAKQQLYGLRQTREAHAEASTIQHKHGSRKSGLAPSGKRKRRSPPADDTQGRLF
jgi:deoxyribodipyrimidine photo-lyase